MGVGHNVSEDEAMKNSKISWCDHTFNPWIGCTKVSPGCANCYAESLDHRWGHDSWGQGKPRRRTSAAYWRQSIRWNDEVFCCAGCGYGFDPSDAGRKCDECGEILTPHPRPRVFCGSLCDWLDDEVPIEWLLDLVDLMRVTPNLNWLLLTKRPQNFRPRLEAINAMLRGPMLLKHAAIKVRVRNMLEGWGASDYNAPEVGTENYWLGTSVEDQQRADERIPQLLAIPAKVRFLSCEPLIGPVGLTDADLAPCHEGHEPFGINWVICGGESGPKARPMHPDWARSLRDQCAAAGVPFFFKQWGEWWPAGHALVEGKQMVIMGSEPFYRVGKHAAGDLLDGQQHHNFPTP